MSHHFLMTDASHYDVRYKINPWMRPDAWRANPAIRRVAAHKASSQLRAALQKTGAVVDSMAGVAGLPDLVFPANAAIVLDGCVLLARFRYSQRQGEEAVFDAAFEALKKRGLVDEIVTTAARRAPGRCRRLHLGCEARFLLGRLWSALDARIPWPRSNKCSDKRQWRWNWLLTVSITSIPVFAP